VRPSFADLSRAPEPLADPVAAPSRAVYTELDSKDLGQEFADVYASRPNRAERKAFEAEQRAKEQGKVDAPFAGIEDERRPRAVDEMRDEAQRLSELFPPENRVEFE